MLKPNIKKIIDKRIKKITEENIAIAFSGGIDSLSILFSCLEQRKNITCYSFTLDKYVSTDFSEARKFANKYNVKFTPIFLPTNINTLKKDLKFLNTMGAEKKVDYTCGYPMLYIYRTMKEKVLISGLGADGHFCISKRGMIHFKDKIQIFRDNLFKNNNYAQKQLNKNIAKYYGKQSVTPYLDKEMIEEFKDTTWSEINKPKQKYATLKAYETYFKKIKVRKHTNLQLGDSKIEENLKQLLFSDWNKNNYKSITGIFNSINRGQL
tara:strand:+ start:2428 stop:3225 length:798 start_codon:yes stop_codon:yes gene_type:complete